MHVKRHCWRDSEPALLFGLTSFATLAAEQQSRATVAIEEVEVTGIRDSLRDALSLERVGARSDRVLSTKLRRATALPGERSNDEPLRMHRETNRTASAATTSTAAVIYST